MSDRLARLLADAASLSFEAETPPFAVSFPSASSASPFAARASARVVGVSRSTISGNQGTVSSGKSYSVLSVCGSDRSAFCMGVMSRTGQLGFCIRKNCGIKSHQAKKFDLPGGDDFEVWMFIVRVAGSNVFAEPLVKEALVPPTVLAEWRVTSSTLPNWVKAFRSVVITEEAEVSKVDGDFKGYEIL